MSPSEICAGGEVGKDTCEGEGGAPLVCLDEHKDQYFLVGLVNYGLGACGSDVPAVYVNMADTSIRDFVTRSFTDQGFCQADLSGNTFGLRSALK